MHLSPSCDEDTLNYLEFASSERLLILERHDFACSLIALSNSEKPAHDTTPTLFRESSVMIDEGD
jgi:hypothetical protein